MATDMPTRTVTAAAGMVKAMATVAAVAGTVMGTAVAAAVTAANKSRKTVRATIKCRPPARKNKTLRSNIARQASARRAYFNDESSIKHVARESCLQGEACDCVVVLGAHDDALPHS